MRNYIIEHKTKTHSLSKISKLHLIPPGLPPNNILPLPLLLLHLLRLTSFQSPTLLKPHIRMIHIPSHPIHPFPFNNPLLLM